MANLIQGVPQFAMPFTDRTGTITQVWYQFLISLFNRTGGASGTNFAPGDGTYVVKSAETGLSNANVAENSTTATWDFTTANVAKIHVTLSSIVIPESQVTNLVSDLANRVLTTTQVIAGTGLFGGGALASNVTLNINTNGVTNSLLAQMPTDTIKGNNTGGTANANDLTATQVTAMLNNFTSSLAGTVPASGGGTTNYLRADATFHNPLSGGISGTVTLAKLTVGGSNGSITYTNGLITSVVAPT